ncbi:tyrosine-type recombinase/integrase [Poseidonibacter lekithochrous]|uniref:tyrosine-type recombinase/integrase n=1 Tax=Poseidonibacter TaxID=2321187 RepID=UPI001C09FAFA|nr:MULTISPECIES: tyrosine-type recombinase/integrase [Poseidonibacter]MBU3013777.1 tyrosine-type recombinase/integrase [Poseidonibacter lekithochrous]MDO6827074.1 tyrosine-type recombinase/integrase [Poseidonibacter sp. 1_MG-2023]
MKKLPKIRIKSNGTFYIKFRVGTILYPYFKKEFITKSFSKKSNHFINLERALILKKYLELEELAKNSLIDKKYIEHLVVDFKINILNQKIENKNLDNCNITIFNAYEKFKRFYNLEQIKESTRKQTYVTLDLFIELIGKNRLIEEIELYDLIGIKSKLEKLGNRNYKEYKHLSLKDYVKVKDVPIEKRINDGSLKSHIKHIKKFFTFCVKNRIIKYNPSDNLTVKVDLDKKDAFTQDEIDKLITIINEYPNELKYLFLIIIYTGMRRNEVFNSTIKQFEGIRYFDINESKTKSGIRKIPIHSKIDFISNYMFEGAKQITNSVNFGAIFNKKIKTLVTTDKRKTLHSIRHYVATKLKRTSASDSMIKTILGHSENDTLNTIYAKEGYSLKQIKEVIEYL